MSEGIIDQAVDTIEVEKNSPDNILIVSEIYEESGDIYFKSLLESDSIKVGSISDWVDKSERAKY